MEEQLKTKAFQVLNAKSFDLKAAIQEGGSRMGLNALEMHQIMRGEVCTEEAFAKLRRGPACYVPTRVWVEEREAVKAGIRAAVVKIEQMPIEVEAIDASADLDHALEEPEASVRQYVRMRPRHLSAVLRRSMKGCDAMLNAVEGLAKAWKWTWQRYCATVMALCYGTKFARQELLLVLNTYKAYKLDSQGWVKCMKAHHALVKVRRRCLTDDRLMSPAEAASVMYMHELVGRGGFMTSDAIAEEAAERQKVPTDYVHMENGFNNFHHHATQTLAEALRDTGKLKKAQSWNQWVDDLYMHLANGSAKVPELDANEFIEADMPDIDLGRFQGKKRFLAELIRPGDFRSYSEFTSTAFLKYEVAKNRFLYPATMQWILLGAYLMHTTETAFYSMRGIDLGHSVESSLMMKIEMVEQMALRRGTGNVDGANFNGEHTASDMTAVLQACVAAGKADDSPDNAAEIVEAVKHYTGHFSNRRIKLMTRTFFISHTLLSGEQTTQFVNSAIMWCLFSVAFLKVKDMPFGQITKFCKGDDGNMIVMHWLIAVCLAKALEDSGMKTNALKDHIEEGVIEHERCLVDEHGYHGSMFRKCGSMPIAEPQGQPNLSLLETIEHAMANASGMRARGAKIGVVRDLIEVELLTMLNDADAVRIVMLWLEVPKYAGGLGVGYLERQTEQRAPLVIREMDLKVVKSRVAKFADGMSKRKANLMAAEYAIMDAVIVREISDELLLDSMKGALPPSYYGTKGKLQTNDIVEQLRQKKLVYHTYTEHDRIEQLELQNLTDAAFELMSNVLKLGRKMPAMIHEVIDRSVSKAGLINLSVAAKVMKMEGQQLKRRLLADGVEEEETWMLDAVKNMRVETCSLMMSGRIAMVFWDLEDRPPTDIVSMISAAAYHVCVRSYVKVEKRRRGPEDRHWSAVVSVVAREVYSRFKTEFKIERYFF